MLTQHEFKIGFIQQFKKDKMIGLAKTVNAPFVCVVPERYFTPAFLETVKLPFTVSRERRIDKEVVSLTVNGQRVFSRTPEQIEENKQTLSRCIQEENEKAEASVSPFFKEKFKNSPVYHREIFNLLCTDAQKVAETAAYDSKKIFKILKKMSHHEALPFQQTCPLRPYSTTEMFSLHKLALRYAEAIRREQPQKQTFSDKIKHFLLKQTGR